MDLKLPFGLKNGQLVQVADVESGLKCGCKCPACNHPLVAKKGSSNIHHFAHHKQSQCAHAFETSIHLAAKEVIEQAGYILLPKLDNIVNYIRRKVLFEEREFHFDKIYLENKYHGIVPDVLLEKDGQLLCVEVYVTHAVDKQKRRKIREGNLSAIEIDLSKIDRSIDFELLKEMVVNSVENKKWLFNREYNNLRNELIKNAVRKKEIESGPYFGCVENCPTSREVWAGKSFARVHSQCPGCRFCINISKSSYSPDEDFAKNDCSCKFCMNISKSFNRQDSGLIEIDCIGHLTESEYNNFVYSNIKFGF